MADFDLTQTDAQVQSILNDAQDAQGAGAQTTLTTDYIMLKGTNGRYHKILKDSFTEAVRNVLSGLLVNNDKGTTISQIPAISSGDFGSVTPANLASVLGVPRFLLGTEIAVNSDVDNLTALPCYRATSGTVTASISNLPSNITPTLGFVLMNIQPYGSPDWGTQVIVQISNIWVRQRNTSSYSPIYTPWKQVQLNSIQ